MPSRPATARWSMLDPKTHTDRGARDPDARAARAGAVALPAAEPAVALLGRQHLWANPPYNPADPHNPMIDSKGRVWLTSKIRAEPEPGVVQRPGEQVRGLVPADAERPPGVVLRPEDQAVHADRHLLRHASPAVRQRRQRDGVLQRAVGPDRRLDRHEGATTRRKDEQKAVGWCGQVVDTNGDGRITRPWNRRRPRRRSRLLYASDTARRYVRAAGRGGRGGAPTLPLDPKLDTQVNYNLYGVMPSPVDDSVWGVAESVPGLHRAR